MESRGASRTSVTHVASARMGKGFSRSYGSLEQKQVGVALQIHPLNGYLRRWRRPDTLLVRLRDFKTHTRHPSAWLIY